MWNGKLVADHDEEYLIAVECNNGGYASHAIDGKYISWQSCYPMMTTSIVMKANTAVHFSLRYKSLEGSAFVILKWASATVSMEKIPSRNLYHQVTVGNNTMHHPVIAPSHAYPPQSVAVGDALRHAISGIDIHFLVESRDEFGNGVVGNLLLHGGTRVEVDAFHYQVEGNLQTTILDNNNGTYTVTFNPGSAGIYFLSVLIDGSDINKSPFLLRVEPGETDPSNSILLGEETIEGVTGQMIQLDLQAIDANGDKRHKGGDGILADMVALSSEGSEEILNCKPEYATEGLYSVSCPTASHAGSYLLHVDIVRSSGRNPIKSSPFQVTIYPGRATPGNTDITSGGSISGNTVEFTSKAGLYESFLVCSYLGILRLI